MNEAFGYPEIPQPMQPVGKRGLPYKPGIYFLWRDGGIVYVGRSTRIGARVRLGRHHIAIQGDMVSWILIDGRDLWPSLFFAECYYIGICRPMLNNAKPNAESDPRVGRADKKEP